MKDYLKGYHLADVSSFIEALDETPQQCSHDKVYTERSTVYLGCICKVHEKQTVGRKM